MGVVSNKVDITELKKGGGGTGDLPGRVTALEAETVELAEGLALVQTSVRSLDLESVQLAEGLARVQTSVNSGFSAFNARIEKLEDNTQAQYYKISVPGDGTTKAKTLASNLLLNLETFYNGLSDGDLLLIDRLLIRAYGDLTCPYKALQKGVDSFRNPVGFGSVATSASSLTVRAASLWKGTTGTSVYEGIVIDLNNLTITRSTSTFETITPSASQELAIYFYVINAVKTPS